MFDCLDPKNLPENTADIPTYVPKIMTLANRFKYTASEVADEFASLLVEIIENDLSCFCAHKNQDNPADFWSFYLSHESVIASPSIRALISTVLSLPVGSADAERGFSILKHTRYDRRNRLTPSHLDDILRVRINGPLIENFDADRYAKKWLQTHKRTEDETGTRKPETKEKKEKTLLRRSNIF